MEIRPENLLHLLPAWVKDAQWDKCLIQFFVSFFDANNARAMAEINGTYEKFSLNFPMFLRVIELYELKLILPSTEFAKPRDGVLHWFQKLEEKKIEPGVYAILGAPFASNNSTDRATEGDARMTLSSFSAMICMLYGFASLHSKKCEFIIDTQNGSYSIASDIIENPAFFKIDHITDIQLHETFAFSKKLTNSSANIKKLVAIALSYVDRATREPNHGIRLSLYFSAMEALLGSTSKNELCKVLKISHDELRRIGYDQLYKRRNLFVHEGQMATLSTSLLM